jgi:N-acetylmuramoyl-L-alanine amidase
MNRCLLATIIVIALILCACQDADAPSESYLELTDTTVPTLETVALETEPLCTQATDPVLVYGGALADYLLPIEEYSWERKFDPEFIMIHFSSAVVNHLDDPHNVQFVRDAFIEYDVSTHYIIERNGTVRCYIPENRVAWHAGAGTWKDDPKYTNAMNQYAIGIEIVAIGSYDDMHMFISEEQYNSLNTNLIGCTQSQYDSLRLLIADICDRHSIPMDRDHIIGHEEYSSKKTDPGELFDWSQIVPIN